MKIKRLAVLIALSLMVCGCGKVAEPSSKALIDYENLKGYEVKTIDKDRIPDWFISIDDFTSDRKESMKNELEILRPALGNEICDNMIGGLETTYFEMACLRSYNETYMKVSNELGQATYLQMDYEKYPDIKLVTPDKYILDTDDNRFDKYASGVVLNILKNANGKYESLIKYNMDKINDSDVSEEYINYLYYDKILNDFSFINSMQLSVKCNGVERIVEYKAGESDTKLLELLGVNQLKGFYGEGLNLDEFQGYTSVELKDSIELDFSIGSKLVEDEGYKAEVKILDASIKEYPSIEEVKDELIQKAKMLMADEVIYNDLIKLAEETKAEQVIYDEDTSTPSELYEININGEEGHDHEH